MILRVSCWTKDSGRLCFKIDPQQVAGKNEEYLKYLAEKKAEESYGIKIHPLHVELLEN